MFTVRVHPVDPTESQILDDLSYVIDRMRFSTQLNGGFGGCEFAIGNLFWHAYRYLEDRLLHRIVISDAGQVYYEGRIIAVTAEPGQLTINCEGYWGYGQDVFLDLIYPSRGDNLVLNPSFEDVAAGPDWTNWTEYFHDGIIEDETTNIADGEHAVKFTSVVPGTLPRVVQWITGLSPNTKYELSFYTRGDGTNGGRYAIDDLDNGWILAEVDTGVIGISYEYITYGFTTPSWCSRVGIAFIGSSANGGEAYFDRVNLRQVVETTITDVVHDAIDMAIRWDSSKVYVDTDKLGTMVVNSGGDGLDYDMDWHLNEVIEDVLKFGTSEDPPRPLYFAIWENRKCYMFPRPKLTSENIKWHMHLYDLAGGQQGLAAGRDASKFGNTIATIYSSGQGERKITSEASDAASIAKYGTIQKRLSVAGTIAGIAEAFRDISLEENKEPRQSVTAMLDSYVWSAGSSVPIYNVRAGDLIRLHLDPRATNAERIDSQVRVLLVTATEYDTANNRMNITLETSYPTLDIMLSWMGLQGARLF